MLIESDNNDKGHVKIKAMNLHFFPFNRNEVSVAQGIGSFNKSFKRYISISNES